MSSVSLPPSTFYGKPVFNAGIQVSGESQFLDRVTITQRASTAEALKLIGATTGNGSIMQVFDFAGNPIEGVLMAGGRFVSGDRLTVFPPGDVFNAAFQIMGSSADNLSATSGGFAAGHSGGQGRVYFGAGAPTAALPVSTGIPANGSLYFRFDGQAANTTVYQVRAGAWTAIL